MSQLPRIFPNDATLPAPYRGDSSSPGTEPSVLPRIFPPNEDRAKALSAIRMTSGVNPDQAARDAQTGRKLNMPRDMVAMDRESANLMLAEQEIYDAEEKHPELLEYFRDTHAAAVSSDDVPVLKKFLYGLKSAGDAITEWQDSAIRAVRELPENFAHDYALGVREIRLNELAWEAMKDDSLLPRVLAEKKAIEEARRKPGGWIDENILQPTAFQGAPFIVEGTKRALPGAMIGAGSAIIAGQMGPQVALPEEIVTVPTAAIAGAGMAAAEWMMRVEGGSNYLEFIEEKDLNGNPIDPQIAKNMAVLGGMANALLEGVGMKAMGKAASPLIDRFRKDAVKSALRDPSFIAAAGNFFRNYGTVMATEVGTENVQELVTVLAGRAAQHLNAAVHDVPVGNLEWAEKLPGRLWETTTGTIGAFGLLMLPGPSMRLSSDISAANRGRSHLETMSAAIDAAAESKTRERDPETFETFCRKALPEEKQVQYIDAETLQIFYQKAGEEGGLAMPEMEKLGIDDMAFEAALQSGAVLPLDTAKFLAYVPTETQRAMKLDLRADPLAMTANEAAKVDFTAQSRALADAYKPDLARAAEYAQEKQRITDELIAAGRSAELAADEAEVLVAKSLAWERSYGFDGIAELQRRKIVPGVEGAVLPDSYGQAAMYKSGAASVADFLAEVSEADPQGNKSFYYLGAARGEQVELGADQVRHIRRRHPDFTEWERIPEIIENGRAAAIGKSRYTQAETYAYIMDEGETALVVLGSPVSGNAKRNRPGRVVTLTAFRANTDAVNNWVSKYESAASPSGESRIPSGARGSRASLPSEDAALSPQSGALIETVSSLDAEVNEIVAAKGSFSETVIQDAVEETRPKDGGEQGDTFFQKVLQSISSADTSLRQVASALKKISWKAGTTNTDIGGGRYDEGTNYLAGQGVENLVFDPFNRNEQHNREVVRRLKAEKTDSATITNVLNVIAEPEARSEVVRQAAKAIKKNGVAYFQIYEGDREGQGRVTSKGWQNNAKTEFYIDEVRKYFGEVKKKGNLIEAKNPKPGKGVAIWMLEGFGGPVEYYQHQDGKNRGATLITPTKDIIQFFKLQNVSTAIHEFGHVFLGDMARIAAIADAPEGILRDYAIVRAYVGAKEGEALTRKQHEKFARGFEAYLREGVSPSFELSAVFHRFRKWLTKLYHFARQLDAPLSDEMRGVFDRLLATEDQLAETRAINDMAENEAKRIAALAEEGGFTAEEVATVSRAYEEAYREAQAAMNRAALRERGRQWKEALANAKDIVSGEPVYAAVDMIRNSDLPPEMKGLSEQHIAENYSPEAVKEIRRKFKGIINNKGGGLGADVLAEDLGFSTGDELVYALVDARKRGERINELAESMIAAEEAATMPDKAALASESYGKYLEKFNAALSKKLRGATYSPREYLARAAQDYIGAMQVREATRYDAHQRTMRAQMNARIEAAKAGDIRAEMFALEKLRLAHEMVGKTLRVREQVTGVEKRIQRIIKSKSINSQFRDQVLGLADRFGIGTAQKPRSPEHMVPLSDIVAGMENDFGWGVSFPEWLLNGGYRQDYRDLTVNEFSQLDNLLRFLEKRGRDEFRESKASYAARIGGMVLDTIAPSRGMAPKPIYTEGNPWRKMTDTSRKFFASLDSLQFLFRSFDGYENVGPEGTRGANERLLMDRIIEGSNARKVRLGKINAELSPHIRQLNKSARAWEKKYGKRLAMLEGVTVPESFTSIGRGWSADAVIAMALHMGTESNVSRLRAGYTDLTPQTRDALLGLLSEADWDAIQGIWDVFESQWADLDAVHYQVNGFHMAKIPAREFMPLGLEKRRIYKKYRGGYCPAIYDPDLSRFVREYSESESIFAQTEAIYQTPAARSGMTKARKDKAPGLPLLLSTSIITRHLTDTATYISLALPIRDADRVTRSGDYEAAFSRVLGRDAYDQIRPALKDIVLPEKLKMDMFDSLVEKARSYATPFFLAWNIKTAIMQFLSAPRGMHDIGVKAYAKGLRYALTENPLDKVQWIMDVSPYMLERAVSRDRELAQMFRGFDINTRSFGAFGKDWTMDDLVNIQFMPMMVTDWVTAYPIWLGKYHTELEKNGGDQQAAVLAADDAVRFSQSSANVEDLPAFLRSGKGMKRLFSLFGTDNIGRYGQRQRYHYRAWRAGKMTTLGYAWFNMVEAVLPAVGLRIFLELIWRGQPLPDEDDDKRWFDFLGDIGNDVLLQGVPLVGNLFSSWRKPLDSPVGAVAERFVKSAKGVGKALVDDDMEGAAEKAFMGLLEMGSIISRVPISRLARNIEKGEEQYSRGDASPLVYLIPEPKN